MIVTPLALYIPTCIISIILDEMTREIKVYIKITLPKITATIDKTIKSVASKILLIGIPVYLFTI